jgi:hypothetical protein
MPPKPPLKRGSSAVADKDKKEEMAPKPVPRRRLVKQPEARIPQADEQEPEHVAEDPQEEMAETMAMSDQNMEGPSQTPPRLTQSLLVMHTGATGGVLSKADKMEMLNQKLKRCHAGEEVEFAKDEQRELWRRTHTAMGKNSKAKAALEEVNKDGAGKEGKKRLLLRAWPSPELQLAGQTFGWGGGGLKCAPLQKCFLACH